MEIVNKKFEKSNFLPFLWIYGYETEEEIVRTVDAIHTAGAKTICVESKSHPYFGEKLFFDDIRTILERAKEHDMGVWLLDEKRCPTGYANGALAHFPHLKKEYLLENHTDISGDNQDIKLIIRKNNEADQLICALACKRVDGYSETLTGEPIDLTSGVHGEYLYCCLPAGEWRIFFIFRSKAYADELVDFLKKDSCALQLKYVYEPLYKEFKEDFGDSFLGFFLDEPKFGNTKYRKTFKNGHPYFDTIGMEYELLPFTDEVIDVLKSKVEGFNLTYLTFLWYEHDQKAPYVRNAYMEFLAECYRDNYVKPISEWCHARGVEVIGHIVEDFGNHAKLGSGVAHYFKAMEYQDMSGIDIVFSQVIPGMSHCNHTGMQVPVDTDFFHYVLCQLGASSAHIDPKKRNRALCECFGAYGWNLDVTHQKWLMDYLMVRGINRFTFHSFSARVGDEHFPPHFYDHGFNPQFGGFCSMTAYSQRVLDKLDGGVHVAPVAMLYDGESQWMNGDEHMGMQRVARPLVDNFYNYDIIPQDALLSSCRILDGKLSCNKESYSCLIVPKAIYLPSVLIEKLRQMAKEGVKIIFVDERTKFADFGEVVALNELIPYLDAMNIRDVEIDCANELLRYYHLKDGDKDKFFFTNESLIDSAKVTVKLPYSGKVSLYDAMKDVTVIKDVQNALSFELKPHETLYVETGAKGEISANYEVKEVNLGYNFDVSLAHYKTQNNFEFYKKADKPFNVLSYDEKPDFAGVVKYDTEFEVKELSEKTLLDLGRVGGVAEITLNGKTYPYLVCPPYSVDVTESIKLGKNVLSVKVAGTPTARCMDKSDPRARSSYIPFRPVGILSEIKLQSYTKEK